MYFKKFPFALQTIFSIHNLEADNFFSQLQLANNFFYKKGIPPDKKIMSVHYAKFGVSNLFFQKLSEKKLWGVGSTPLVKKG